MDYRITAADAALGQIEVTYLKDGVSVAAYTIDVPIVDGQYITGDALAQEIMRRAPLWLVERQQAANAAPNFANIQALVQSVAVADVVDPNGSSERQATIVDQSDALVESRANMAVPSDNVQTIVTTL